MLLTRKRRIKPGAAPGTIAGAVGQGYLDALVGGVSGILLGAGIFASLYPRLQKATLAKGGFGELTLPQLLKVNPWAVVIPAVILLTAILFLLQKAGL